ncbi:MAG: sulfite exporter TauE/SafE family protein [Deltaproteobacteria bacterium]|nr:sulfite exporter TauE/SafE family protein [Deltaproteobacteria bacterium]
MQGVLGFGFGLMAAGLLPWLLGVKGAVPVVATMALLVNGTLMVRFRHHVSFGDARPLILGALVGAPIGVFALRSASPGHLMVALGLVILAYVGRTLSRRTTPEPMGSVSGAVLGTLAGVLGGAFSTAGPPSVVWVSTQPWSSQQLRATLVTLFAVVGALQVSLLIRAGMLTTDTGLTAAIIAPAAALGSFVGARLGDRVPQDKFQRLMLAGLGVLACTFIFNGLRDG